VKYDKAKLKARHLLAQNIRVKREQQGFSQEKLGELSGLHRTYIGMIERGGQNVSIDNIERIAMALSCDTFELLRDRLL